MLGRGVLGRPGVGAAGVLGRLWCWGGRGVGAVGAAPMGGVTGYGIEAAQNAGQGIGRRPSGIGMTGRLSRSPILCRSAVISRTVMCSLSSVASGPARTRSNSATASIAESSTGVPAQPHRDRPEFVLDMQRHSVVDAVDAAVDRSQHVTPFSVRVVDDHIEDGDAPQANIVGVNERHLIAPVVVGAQHRKESAGNRIRGTGR